MRIPEIRLGINMDLEPVHEKIKRLSKLYEEIQEVAAELADLNVECKVFYQEGSEE